MTREIDVSAEGNIGLVHAVAARFKGRGIEYEELFAAGCLGLVKASDRFDSSRGLCFSTYAVPLIMGEIKCLFRRGGALKVSRNLKESALKVNKARSDYIARTGGEPTVKELSETSGLSEEIVIESLCACRQPISLTGGDDEQTQSVADIAVDSGEERVAERISLRQEIERLPEEDRYLIELRYFRALTQTQTAKFLGTSQVQVCRREKKILAALKQRLS
ncbi:MAG: sigma-70 family RNA polymerase sigma factor [Clostridia bacterium]|nr:sigma-70 family RNA polymerase sigma factor [Clostridia bacterium]